MKFKIFIFLVFFSTFYWAQVPKITSFSPTSAEVGDTVTITGTGFDATPANNVVYFGAVKASVITATTTNLTVTVPFGSTYEPITVTIDGYIASSKTAFRVVNSVISNEVVKTRHYNNSGVSFSTVSNAYSWQSADNVVAVADFDNDGKPDVSKVKSSPSAVVRVHLNTAVPGIIDANSFDSGTDFSIYDATSYSIRAADFDGDGKKDIAALTTGGFVSFLRNTSTSTGNISFATKFDLAVNNNFANMDVADFDGDGKIDIVIQAGGSYGSSSPVIYLNTSTVGNISFSSMAHTLTSGAGPKLTVSDIDGDGKTDIITSGGTVDISINGSTPGSISFTSINTTTSSSSFIITADYDNDGDNDMMDEDGTFFENTYSGSGGITNADFTTTSISYSMSNSIVGRLSTGDFNTDGKVDYFHIDHNSSSKTYMLLNNISGSISSNSFTGYITYSHGKGRKTICDFDGDGKNDILTSDYNTGTFSILRNNIGETIYYYPLYSGYVYYHTFWDGAPSDIFTDSDYALKLIKSGVSEFNIGGSDWTVANKIVFSDAHLNLGWNNFDLSGVAEGISASAYIKTSGNGSLKQTVSTSVKSFGIGNSTYNPVSITNNSGVDDVYSVRVSDRVNQDGSSNTNSWITKGTNSLQRQWIISKNSSNDATLGSDITFNWNESDSINGVIDNPALFLFDGTDWNKQTTGVTVSGTSITISGYTGALSNTQFAIADADTGLKAPGITITGSLLPFETCTDDVSSAQSFVISASGLTADISIAALSGYEFSTDDSTYSSTLTLAQTSGSVADTTVYVRLTGSSSGSPSGNITLSSTGVTSQTIAVSGIVNALPTITLSTVANINVGATSFNIPYTSVSNSPSTYSLSAGTNALTNFSSIIDQSFTGTAGDLAVVIPNDSAPGTYDFNVTVKNGTTGCESEVYAITLTINAPSAPITDTNVTYCTGETASPLSATAQSGYTLQWYTESNGGTASTEAPTPDTSTASATYYYVSQKDANGFESEREEIIVTIFALPEAPTASDINYCINETATALTATAAIGNTLQWYTEATGGTASATAPTPSTTTVGSTTYYVSQKAIADSYVIDNPISGYYNSFVSNFGQTFQVTSSVKLNSISIQSLYFSDSNTTTTLKIYSGFGGNLLATADATFVNTIPNWNTNNVSFSFSNQNVVLNSGFEYYFELVNTSTVYTRTSTSYIGGTGYADGSVISQDFAFILDSDIISNPCESDRTPIVVSVYDIPTAPNTTDVSYCRNETATVLTATAESGNTLQWYTEATGGTASTTAPTPSTASAGTTTYYVSQKNDASGCESARAAIDVVVEDAPYAYDRAMNFASSGYLSSAPTTTLNLYGSNSFTLEAWIYPTSFNESSAGVISKGNAFSLKTESNGVLSFIIEQSWSWERLATSANALSTETWQHVAATYDGDSRIMKLFINGNLVGTLERNQNFSPDFTSGNLQIGRNISGNGGYSRQFNGNIDEVKIWNSVKSPNEIASNYTNELQGTESNLMAYYKFDQGTGSSDNTDISVIIDSSTNGNDLTINSMDMTGSSKNILQIGPAIFGVSEVCLNSTETLTHTNSGGSWSSSDSSVISIDASGNITANASGTATITYTYTYNTCSYESTKTITVNELPSLPTVADISYCEGETGSALTATATTGHSLQWYTEATGGTASTTAPTPSTTSAGTTTYYVSQKNDATGCESDRASITVTVSDLPVISGDISVAVGESITLSATTTPATTNAWVSFNPANATVDANGEVSGLTQGNTVITYTNANGCSVDYSITVTVGATQDPLLTLPATDTTGATTLQVDYTLPEAPLSGSVTLTFTPTDGSTATVWTMTDATSATFNYEVGSDPTTITNVVSGAALSFTTYNVTISYQDAFSNPIASTTNTNIQTLAPPAITLSQADYNGVINVALTAISTTNTGGTITAYAISPTLPSGLSFSTSTGVISGTPTVALSQTQFTITATNAAGSGAVNFNLFIDIDTDNDGEGDATDPDIDGDGINNNEDVDPDGDGTNDNGVDTDGDGINNANDSDIDGDGINNATDPDIDGDGIPNDEDVDPDGDGTNDNGEDTDGDGINDASDPDIDDDGIPNDEDVDPDGDGTNDNGVDTDGDGINNANDSDIDGDGINNANDPDIDGDGINNNEDVDPDGDGTNDNGEDTDGDGINDASDPDIDGDGINNNEDVDPDGDGTNDNGEDTDGDGINDASDPDIDGDGIPNDEDVDPDGDGTNDNGEDTDGDGINDASDPDIDGDGINNNEDVDPDGDGTNDNGEDTDGDGINDASDPDIDGDGINNNEDVDPDGDGTNDNGEDTDGDGINDASDPDIDGDGINNNEDVDPDGDGTNDNGEDTDGDGINDASDPDIDGDGINNNEDVDPDGDGINDNGEDTDGDGINNTNDSDIDGDGINNVNDPDIDGDGIPNDEDVDPDGDGTNDNGEDTDGDGINDASDPDIDGDGINNASDPVQDIIINEGSDWGVFEVKGLVGDVFSLRLIQEAGEADLGNSPVIQSWNGSNWIDYNTDDQLAIPNEGTLFIRVNITNEQDTNFEGAETFALEVIDIPSGLVGLTVYDANFQTFNLDNYTRTGTDGAAGTTYKKVNAITIDGQAIDVVISIDAKSNVSSFTFDNDTNPSRFEPQINSNSSSGSFVDFTFDFFLSGTTTKVGMKNFVINPVDIDGSSSSKEFVELFGLSSYQLGQGSGITVIQNPQGRDGFTRFEGINSSLSGIAFEETASFIAYYNKPVDQFKVRMGVTGSSSSTRLFSSSIGSAIGTFNQPSENNITPIIGIATIKDDGTGNYWIGDNLLRAISSELVNANISLDDDQVKDINSIDITVAPIAELVYTGLGQTPSPVIKDGMTELEKDTDYELSYANNTDVGTATVTITGINDYDGSLTTTFEITKAALTVTADSDQTKVYGATDPALTYTITGLVNSDTESSLDTAVSIARVVGEDVGTYTITPSGAVDSNYDISFVTADFSITKAALTVTADSDQTKVYGATDPALTYTITGLVNSDTESSLDTAVSIARVVGEDVGTYTITPSGAVDSNYDISFVTADFSITKAALTVTADSDQTKVYGATDPALTYTITGLVNSDTESSLDTAVSIARVVGEDVGTYTITPSGAVDSNYDISFVTADFSITKAALTVTADSDQTKVYGATDPALTYTITGLVNSDTESSLDTAVSIARVVGEDVGTYTITPSGAVDSNYDISFVTADFTITSKLITDTDITVSPITDLVYNGSLQRPKPMVEDGSNLLDEGIDYRLSYSDNINVGQAIVTITGLGNYNGSRTVTFMIVPKVIAIIIPDQEKDYGAQDPVLVFTADPVLFGSDEFTGSLSRESGEAVGDYLITSGTLSAGSNYSLDIQTDAIFRIIRIDSDGDGVADDIEETDGTDPTDSCDLVLSSQTFTPSTAWNIADCDSDGVSNADELTDGTDPLNPDSDGDGVLDGTEKTDGTDGLDFCSSIPSNITLSVSQGYLAADCDDDGLSNGDEIGPDVNNPIDSDNDGVFDYLEYNNHTTPIEDDLEVFNLLTPNNDGENDVFVIRNIELYPENTLEIYNRWGVKVYGTPGYGQNGRYFIGVSNGRGVISQSSLLPAGTYFYILKYKSSSGDFKERKGYLYLTR